MSSFKLFFYLLIAVIIVGCSSAKGPVDVDDLDLETPSTMITDDGEQVAVVQPVIPEAKVLKVPLVERLIDQSNQSLDNNSFDQAINLAEQGLRIDRKEPRLYLVLVKTYVAKGNRQQANYFAQQGLRYAGKKQAIYKQLKQYIR